jgi:hypothetical protein
MNFISGRKIQMLCITKPGDLQTPPDIIIIKIMRAVQSVKMPASQKLKKKSSQQ